MMKGRSPEYMNVLLLTVFYNSGHCIDKQPGCCYNKIGIECFSICCIMQNMKHCDPDSDISNWRVRSGRLNHGEGNKKHKTGLHYTKDRKDHFQL